MSRGRWVASLTAASVIVVLGFLLLNGRQVAITQGGQAPRFAARSIDSLAQERTLDDYAGEPLFLNVWATWCDPCREEMPSIERMYRDYRRRGLRVVAISIDDAGQLPLVHEFVQEHGLTFEILHDANAQMMPQYQMLGVPQTFLISRRGQIVATRFVADWSAPTSRALVDSLLAIR